MGRGRAGKICASMVFRRRGLSGPVRPIQVDRGSEFQAGFEDAYQQKGNNLFVLSPRSPKINGRLERAQRTHTADFYNCTTASSHGSPELRFARLGAGVQHHRPTSIWTAVPQPGILLPATPNWPFLPICTERTVTLQA